MQLQGTITGKWKICLGLWIWICREPEDGCQSGTKLCISHWKLLGNQSEWCELIRAGIELYKHVLSAK